jgi:hypothetical protein
VTHGSVQRNHFLTLSHQERAEILESIAPAAGLSPLVLEKDVWVVWVLDVLFSMPNCLPIAFKGGTSLSKIYGAISRFSEDIDLTIDYKALNQGQDPLTSTMSGNAIKKLSDALKAAVAAHVRKVIVPYILQVGQEQLGFELAIEIGGEDGEAVRVRYPTAFQSDARYLPESVLLEFGGRNTTLPNERHTVRTYAERYVSELSFPVANVVVLSPQRTFWEKATLIHSECHRPRDAQRVGPERISRHWYDLIVLAEHDIGRKAVADRELLGNVVALKGIFYKSGFANYQACVDRQFRLLPDDDFLAMLAADYAAMVNQGMFFAEPPKFEDIIKRITELQTRLNA